MSEEDLEELRRRKMQEAQSSEKKETSREEAEDSRNQQIWSKAKQHMTNEASSRLGNIKAANKQKAISIASRIAQLGPRMNGKVDENQLKEILRETEKQSQKDSGDIKFRR